ncbi:hypothetical protein CROQUDRAFT_48535 [Cronartium quercuum f. sp. fusiforme G11]|uniref:VLRF1 domain-containing protein n=1 Tax=Cronartium quercuum f. sp. fusiforme G11 TaxID=708437 RepID=A0A9P6NBK8_9BASI|nr:hypothetical protein CROQUDRAFT_48535 [Cronartium quercuum f. sp. fusiforme G11]
MSVNDAKGQIQVWGQLYALDLPKSLRGTLWKCHTNESKLKVEEHFKKMIYRNSPNENIDESNRTWTEQDDSKWYLRPLILDEICLIKIYRSILPQSYGRDSGALFKKPLDELKHLQFHLNTKGQANRHNRRWSLMILGINEIGALEVQTELEPEGDDDSKKSIQHRLVVLREEVAKYENSIEGTTSKNSRKKSKKFKTPEKISRKSNRGVDTSPKSTTVDKLLHSWQKQLEESELIFIGASRKDVSEHFPETSTAYRKLRPFPFAFGIPSVDELKRCFVVLTTAEIQVGF